MVYSVETQINLVKVDFIFSIGGQKKQSQNLKKAKDFLRFLFISEVTGYKDLFNVLF